MSALDKSRDYGEIYNDSEGRRYVQDGVFFDEAGNQVGGEEAAPVRAPRARKVPAADATANPAASQVAAQLGSEFE